MLHFTYISQLGWTMNDFRSLNQNCYLLPTDSALNRHLSIWNMRHSKNWWFQQFGTNMPIVYEFTNKFVNKLMILCENGKCKSNIKINTIFMPYETGFLFAIKKIQCKWYTDYKCMTDQVKFNCIFDVFVSLLFFSLFLWIVLQIWYE